MSGVNNSVETVNAAATAIFAANSRVQQVTSPRRRWGGCFSMYWCFKSQKQDRRVNHSNYSQEAMIPIPGHMVPEVPSQISAPLPFAAPPSSPASFLQSDPSSAAHSPVNLFSLTALSAEAYSPGGPASIFAIGPYANDTQLVSPPIFSTFTTEPSTAPLTPPEPVHFTTPSSPEVPFAELLMSSLDSTLRKSEGQGFQTYQWYPGSPIGNLISPSSVCSGTSSPFPDREFHSSINGSFSSFPIADPPKLLPAEGLALRKMAPLQSSSRGDESLVGDQISTAMTAEGLTDKSCGTDALLSQRVSFDLSNKEDVCSATTKSEASMKAVSEPPHLDIAESSSESNNKANESGQLVGCYVNGTYHDLPAKLKLSQEFKFDNVDEGPKRAVAGPDWWANEDVNHIEAGTSKSWAFFPIKQPGVS